MFDDPTKVPVPTLTTISWLLEDYGLSRTENVPADIFYWRISTQWSSNPLPAVIDHPYFCSCLRRYKWNPHATLISLEYKWPIIPIWKPKATAAECQVTCRKFFEAHIQYLDPVCFRAAVFVTLLPIGVANGMWQLTSINFLKVNTNFFYFWNCNIDQYDG